MPTSRPETLRLLAWLLACASLAGYAAARGASGQREGLVAPQHRATTETYLRLDLHPDADTETLDAALASLDLEGRCPLAPPPAEARRWLDAHRLTLLPRSEHAALAARLDAPALRRAIAGARARLSSPFAGLVEEDLRRDPIGLATLGDADLPVRSGEKRLTPGARRDPAAGRLGFLTPRAFGDPRPGSLGDLLSADGRSALACFQTGLSSHVFFNMAHEQVGQLPLDLRLDGGATREEAARSAVAAAAPRALIALAAALTLALALALRRVRPVLALILGALGPAAALAAALAPLGALDLPLLLLAAGFAAAPGRPHLASDVLAALALVPLLLTPYPAWSTWALAWALALAAAALARRAIHPQLLALLGAHEDPPPPAAPQRPAARARLAAAGLPAALAGLVLLPLGAWTIGQVPFDPPLARAEGPADDFFDPDEVARLESPGEDPPAALARAADDLDGLAPLLDGAALRVDAPGAFVVPAPELEARLAGLRAFDARGRLDLLRDLLASGGLRPDAFAEFLRDAAADLEDPASPAAALAGPIGPWLARRIGPAGAETRVYLAPIPEPLPPLRAADGRPLELRGPGVFSRAERARLGERLALVVTAGAWLAAFVAWLATRRLALALALALTALTAQSALLVLCWLLDQPIGPATLPLVALAGATAASVALRALQTPGPRRVAFVLGPLAAALALITAAEPAWRALGLAAALALLAALAASASMAPALLALADRMSSQPRATTLSDLPGTPP